MIKPLRKHTKDGDLYVRTPPVLAQLQELIELDREQLLRRCAIDATSHSEYVYTECLLYFVRASKEDNSDAWFERLYKLLNSRVLKKLPGGKNAPPINADIGQKAFDRFTEILSGLSSAHLVPVIFNYSFRFFIQRICLYGTTEHLVNDAVLRVSALYTKKLNNFYRKQADWHQMCFGKISLDTE